MSTEPFAFDDALKRALDDDPVPAISDDFADRLLAAARDRAPPLPKSRPAPARRWRTGRRLVIGLVAGGALATTAAATGLLDDLGIDLPSPREVWSAVTGEPDARPAAAVPAARATQAAPVSANPVIIEGPIDTPEELEEAFRRVDEARANRREGRRERIDDRIDAAIERRRAQGQPLTPEQEEHLRTRIDTFRDRAEEQVDQRSAERREDLRRTLEEKGEVTREDIIRDPNSLPARRLQQLRQLPPDERRERLREWRERRDERLRPPSNAQPVDPPVEASEDPPLPQQL